MQAPSQQVQRLSGPGSSNPKQQPVLISNRRRSSLPSVRINALSSHGASAALAAAVSFLSDRASPSAAPALPTLYKEEFYECAAP